MTYEEALAWLDSLESLGIRPGLDRIRALASRLGDPQDGFPSVLIAGTNGKGSVAAFLASILRSAGHEPGVYTSPHLVRFEERIVAGGSPISWDDLADLAGEVRAAIDTEPLLRSDPPTYFEATTALAFLHFARRKTPFAVLEVGMGGRYDATNIVTPVACAITPISMDHTRWLGETLQEIAFQKAGILKPGVPAVVSRQDAAALEVIRREARGIGSPLTLTSQCEVESGAGAGRGPAPDPPVFSLTTPSGGRYPRLAPSLRGRHQLENAVTAVLLAERVAASGVGGIGPESIAAGLRAAVWPGRLELIPGAPDLLLDGAHNPAGCATLAAYLRERHSGRAVILIFAAMKDKPAAEMLDILGPLVRSIILTALPLPRGESPGTLRRLAENRGLEAAETASVDDALRLAFEDRDPGALVVVSGSLYLVGEVKRILAGGSRPAGTPGAPSVPRSGGGAGSPRTPSP